MRAIAYIDGFNLYYGCLKGTPYKWLNLQKMLAILYPALDIQKIKYFTAKVSSRPSDTDCHIRQDTYLRALRTLPDIEIHLGYFSTNTVSMPAAQKPHAPVWVIKTEEKCSDVNIASHLLLDACKDAYDVAIFVSNDSDLLCPIAMVRKELGKKVFMVSPHQRVSVVLAKEVDSTKKLRQGLLNVSQFPENLQDRTGVFHKPFSW